MGKALKELKEEVEKMYKIYKERNDAVNKITVGLFNSRIDARVPLNEVINCYECKDSEYGNSELTSLVCDIKIELDIFQKNVDKSLRNINVNAKELGSNEDSTKEMKAAMGVEDEAFDPISLMAIGTTFGMDSKGAALAWLGGVGIFGGNALLALLGPIGIGIGAAAIGGAAHKKNKEIQSKLENSLSDIKHEIEKLKIMESRIILLNNQINNNLQSVQKKYLELYTIDSEKLLKEKLFKLIINCNQLALLLNKTISINE